MDFEFYRCPRCGIDQARLVQPDKDSDIWLCIRCTRLYWLVTNLLTQDVFVQQSKKVRSFDANNCKRPKRPKGAENDDEQPF